MYKNFNIFKFNTQFKLITIYYNKLQNNIVRNTFREGDNIRNLCDIFVMVLETLFANERMK